MGLIPDSEKEKLKELFRQELKDTVEIGFIEHPGVNEEYTQIGKQLLEELAEAAEGKIKVNYYTKDEKPEFCEHEVCGPIIYFEKYPNVRFYGLPATEEFPNFIDEIIEVSHGHVHTQSERTKELAQQIDKKIKILVFVTPTCPYCPFAVRYAHTLAKLNPNVMAAMVEAYEFPQWADQYKVSAVPKNVVLDENNNVLVEWEGAPPSDAAFAEMVLQGLKKQ